MHVVVNPLFDENTYILWNADSKACFVVDPGFDTVGILGFLRQKELVPEAILNTHGHCDHIIGNEALKEEWPDCPLLIGSVDAPMLTDPALNLSQQYGQPYTSPAADRLLNDGETLTLLDTQWTVLEIPGHSPGHVVFHCQETEPGIVLGGDVLFAGSIGRTDFPGGSAEQLISGIQEKLFTLPADTVVCPGHGPKTTIGTERETNPYVHA